MVGRQRAVYTFAGLKLNSVEAGGSMPGMRSRMSRLSSHTPLADSSTRPATAPFIGPFYVRDHIIIMTDCQIFLTVLMQIKNNFFQEFNKN